MKHKSKEKSQKTAKKQTITEAGELKELRARIEDLESEKEQLFLKLQRISADYANLQKRTIKQITDDINYQKESMIKTLLPALDNFEHTLQKAPSAENPDVLVKGIRIIYDQLLDILKSHGVEQITALGEKFDPALHQAMMQKSEPDKQENTVLEEFQKGYKLNGRVIRPSKVVVSKLPPTQPADQQKPDDKQSEQDEQQIDRE